VPESPACQELLSHLVDGRGANQPSSAEWLRCGSCVCVGDPELIGCGPLAQVEVRAPRVEWLRDRPA